MPRGRWAQTPNCSDESAQDRIPNPPPAPRRPRPPWFYETQLLRKTLRVARGRERLLRQNRRCRVMTVRQMILRTEASHDDIRSKPPDHPNHIGKNLVVIPDPQGLLRRLGESEINRSREKLLAMIESPSGEQFLRSNNAETLAQFRSDQILTAISARNRKISRLVKRTVRPQRHQICVFIIGMGSEVEDPAKHIEFLQGELDLATTHRFGK